MPQSVTPSSTSGFLCCTFLLRSCSVSGAGVPASIPASSPMSHCPGRLVCPAAPGCGQASLAHLPATPEEPVFTWRSLSGGGCGVAEASPEPGRGDSRGPPAPGGPETSRSPPWFQRGRDCELPTGTAGAHPAPGTGAPRRYGGLIVPQWTAISLAHQPEELTAVFRGFYWSTKAGNQGWQ